MICRMLLLYYYVYYRSERSQTAQENSAYENVDVVNMADPNEYISKLKSILLRVLTAKCYHTILHYR